MGLQIRDERQRKALTGLSQAQFDSLLPVFSDIYRAAQQQRYEEGSPSGTRRRRPGGGSKGKLPTMVEKLQFVLYYYKTYPTFDVLGTQFAMARSKAHENLQKLSPMLHDTLVHLELMPYRELATPEALKAALQGVDHLLIDAPERAYHRSQENAKQREHYNEKKNSIRCRTRLWHSLTSLLFFLVAPSVGTITTISCCNKSCPRSWIGLSALMFVSI